MYLFILFVYLILSHLILDFEYSYHARFPVFNVMQVKDKNKNFIIFNLVIFNLVIKICLYTNSFLNNFIICIFLLSCIQIFMFLLILFFFIIITYT